MKPRTLLGALALATIPLLPATPAQAAEAKPSPDFGDILDLDAGTIALAADILGVNGKGGIIGTPGNLLGQ
ncbi:hypothetical protein [Streptomyces aureus]|uniref:hypothetical protein n=1 Tax=Streptomyces aureus TaxID=193461 RepID=UPI00131E9ADA|nr:hypothetical protein [Streptomyces aureus]